MKNNKWVLLAMLGTVLAFVMLVLGCAHSPIIADVTIPEQQLATVYWAGVDNFVHPVSYNDINVNWRVGAWGYYPIKLPAGKTTLGLAGFTRRHMTGVNAYGGTTIYTAYDDKFDYTGSTLTYNFEAGKIYTICFITDSVTLHTGKSISKDTIITKFDINFK